VYGQDSGSVLEVEVGIEQVSQSIQTPPKPFGSGNFSKGQKFVVVTHHAPSRESIPPALDEDPCNPAFASDMSRFIVESEARLWVHGHIHYCCDYTLGKTRVLANPRVIRLNRDRASTGVWSWRCNLQVIPSDYYPGDCPRCQMRWESLLGLHADYELPKDGFN